MKQNSFFYFCHTLLSSSCRLKGFLLAELRLKMLFFIITAKEKEHG